MGRREVKHEKRIAGSKGMAKALDWDMGRAGRVVHSSPRLYSGTMQYSAQPGDSVSNGSNPLEANLHHEGPNMIKRSFEY